MASADKVDLNEVAVKYTYTNIQKRIVHTHTYKTELGDVTYIFRGVPSYGTTDSEKWGNSIIEVFVIDTDGKPQNTNNILDKATLASLLSEVP